MTNKNKIYCLLGKKETTKYSYEEIETIRNEGSLRVIELEKKIQLIQMQQEYWMSRVILQTLLNGHIFRKQLFEIPLRKHYE